jgi:hypothetical protein
MSKLQLREPPVESIFARHFGPSHPSAPRATATLKHLKSTADIILIQHQVITSSMSRLGAETVTWRLVPADAPARL